MKKYADRLREYEYKKQILMNTCETSEELSKKLKGLIKELRI